MTQVAFRRTEAIQLTTQVVLPAINSTKLILKQKTHDFISESSHDSTPSSSRFYSTSIFLDLMLGLFVLKWSFRNQICTLEWWLTLWKYFYSIHEFTGNESFQLTTQVLFQGIDSIHLMIQADSESIHSNQFMIDLKPFDWNRLMNQIWVVPKSVPYYKLG